MKEVRGTRSGRAHPHGDGPTPFRRCSIRSFASSRWSISSSAFRDPMTGATTRSSLSGWRWTHPNVYCESGWCFQSRIVEFAKELPKHKIVFGTDSPPNEPGMCCASSRFSATTAPGLGLSEDDLEGYLGNNIGKLVGIDPTPPPRQSRGSPRARLTDTYRVWA